MADDYRDPLAAAHARIAVLERENEELRHATAEPRALGGEPEAMRLDQELLRMDLTWERRWSTGVGFDAKRLGRRLGLLRNLTIGAAIVVATGPALVGMLPWFVSICCAMLLMLATWIWTLSERQLMREWPEHQAKRAQLQQGAAQARAEGEVSPVAVRVHALESETTPVEDDEAEVNGGRPKARS